MSSVLISKKRDPHKRICSTLKRRCLCKHLLLCFRVSAIEGRCAAGRQGGAWRARVWCIGRWRRGGSRSEGRFIAILLSAFSMSSREYGIHVLQARYVGRCAARSQGGAQRASRPHRSYPRWLYARSNVKRRMRGRCRHEWVATVVVLDLALVADGSTSASSANT